MNKKEKQQARLLSMIELIKAKDSDSLKIVVPGFLAKKSVSYMLIREDLLFLEEAILRLLHVLDAAPKDHVIITCIWQSLIVTYGKCFTENQGGFSKLTEDLITSDEFKETHERLMDLRHSFIAHRDDTEKEIAFVYMRIPKEDGPEGMTEYKIQSTKERSPSKMETEQYLSLIRHLIQCVNEKIQKQTQKAHETMMKMFTPKELALMRF